MTDPQTLAVYQANAERYSDLEISDDQKAALDRFLESLPPNAHVLDLGCGPGLHAAHMMAHGHSVDAIDATPAFVEAAIARGVTARLATFDDITGDALYDGIWASFSLLHAPREDVPGYIAALTRSLKAGGTFFLGMKTGSGAARDDLGRHYAYFTELELARILIDNNMRVTETAVAVGEGLAGTTDPYVLIFATKEADA